MSFSENPPMSEDDDLYDMLNLSPPMGKYIDEQGVDQQLHQLLFQQHQLQQQFHQQQQHQLQKMQLPHLVPMKVESGRIYLNDQEYLPQFQQQYQQFQPENQLQQNQQQLALHQATLGLELLSPKYSQNSNLASSSFNQYQQNHLDPRSPSAYSSNSIYSDNSSQPASPYLDAASQFSSQHAFSDVGNNNNMPQTTQYLDTYPSNALNSFDSEIALGGSISSTNLAGKNDLESTFQPPIPQFNYSINNQPMPEFNSHSLVVTPPNDEKIPGGKDKLTENNLANYTNSLPRSKDIVISIQHAPEQVAAKTPSLFSNSSANSSIHNSPRAPDSQLSRQNTGGNNGNTLVPNSQLLPSSPGGSVYSNTSDMNDDGGLLKPNEFESIRHGRRRTHSNSRTTHTRSRSHSRPRSPARSGQDTDDEDEDEDEYYDDDDSGAGTSSGVPSREKMLELASPTQSTKRTQKHPSVYACHLCEKRFTRPYNLKSHLRTHTDERPFICNVCGKAFARQHDRKRHEELHTGEKKFQCKGFLKDGTPYGCGRKFARADALRRHFQTENGKACIRLLVEEEKLHKFNDDDTNSNDTNGFLTPPSRGNSIPQVAISPPE
jgi:uncharacterized Zn-finger protein